jgi:hypothetical protein
LYAILKIQEYHNRVKLNKSHQLHYYAAKFKYLETTIILEHAVLNAGSRLWLTSSNWLDYSSSCLVTDLTFRGWLLAAEIHLFKQIRPDQIQNTFLHDLSSIATIWLPKRRLTVDSICCHEDVFSFWGNTLILSLAIRCSDNNCLPSRCLGMDAVVQEINFQSDSTIPAFRQHATIS